MIAPHLSYASISVHWTPTRRHSESAFCFVDHIAKMLVRFPHSSFVALSAAFILLAGATDLPETIYVAPITDSQKPLVRRKGTRSITSGSLILALSLMIRESWRKVGLVIGVIGGAVSLVCGLGVTFGFLAWEEEHFEAVVADQRAKMEQVLEALDIGGQSGKIRDLIDGKIEMVDLETNCGKLLSERVGDGYLVTLGSGEKARTARLIRGNSVEESWVEVARSRVEGEWLTLISRY